jgi:(p)ppGpp synthase/HD superfamily hydrolase
MKLPPITTDDLLWAKENLEAIKQLAISFHEGQVDLGGNPYYLHLQYVADKQTSIVGKVLAWLHDCLEERKTTRETLLACGFPLAIVLRIERLSKDEAQTYETYIHAVAEDMYTRRVKIWDIDHNLQLGRLKKWSDRMIPRIKKYMLSLQYLLEVDRAA